MSLIFKQTYKNVIFTYFGILFGAVNIIFLYPLILKDTYFGLVAFLTSFANLLMPLLTVGVQNGLVKFYTSFSKKEEQKGFVFLMFVLPLVVSIPVGGFFFMFYNQIADISDYGNMMGEYLWLSYILGLSYAYFEVFYAWAKTHMQSIYGNFLKEVFHRVLVTLFLVLVYYREITPRQFIFILSGVFVFRTLLMFISAMRTRKIEFSFKIPSGIIRILKYNMIMLLLGFFTILLMSADRIFIGHILSLKQVAYYTVAVFISSVIAIPSKSMHHITNTITANLLNDADEQSLNRLYKNTSTNLYVVSGFIFLIIVLNIHEFYKIVSNGYEEASLVIILSCARLLESVMGNNNSIIFNSNHFRSMFNLLIVMTLLVLGLLYFSTTWWGIYGTSLAVFCIYFLYHIIKLVMVYVYFGIHPFSKNTVRTTLVIIAFFCVFYFWDFNFSPIVNIILKSMMITSAFLWCLYWCRLSDNLKEVLKQSLSRIFFKLKS